MNSNIDMITSILCFAISLFLISYAFLRRVTDVPEEDRQYQDTLPTGFKLMWPAIRVLVHFFGQSISRKYRIQVHNKLCYGGADYILSAEQFILAHTTAGLYMGSVFWLILKLFNINSIFLLLLISVLGLNLPNSWLNKRIKLREKEILRALPTYLDILTLSMESGSNFTTALDTAVDKSKPSPLRQEFNRVLRDIQAGKTKLFALNGLRTRVRLDAINTFVSSIIQAEKTGSPVGKMLRAQADQRRFERFALAEKLGMEAPVKLLGPLILFIFPTTFLILIFLITVKIYNTGVINGQFIDILMSDPRQIFSLPWS